MKQWLQRKFYLPVLTLLRQGVDPKHIALSLAFGLGLGIFPVLGLPTILCTLAAIGWRLNLPAVQLVNYLAAPLQLALIIPFVRVGEHVLSLPPQALSIKQGLALIASGPVHAVIELWSAILHAALGWLLIGPPLIFGLYRLSTPLMRAAARKVAGDRMPAGVAKP